MDGTKNHPVGMLCPLQTSFARPPSVERSDWHESDPSCRNCRIAGEDAVLPQNPIAMQEGGTVVSKRNVILIGEGCIHPMGGEHRSGDTLGLLMKTIIQA